MDATIVVSRVGEVESILSSTLRCPLISDARLVQYPSFPMVEALSCPVFNRTIPESSAPRLKQKKVRLEFIANFGVFINGGSSIFSQLFTELVWFKILFSNTDVTVK